MWTTYRDISEVTAMAENYRRLTDFLLAQGVDQVSHTGKSFWPT